MMNKNEMLLKELCVVGGLENYKNILEELIELITKSGCQLSARYDVEYSNIETARSGGYRIRVSLKNIREPLNIIWTMLHEYGHFLSGKKKESESILLREELAWDHAEKIIDGYSKLSIHKESFYRCKEDCLTSYRKLT